MPAKTILTLLFLISLCVVVILGLRALPRGIDVITASSKGEILVAATPLPGGTLLRAKDVALKHILGRAQSGQNTPPPNATRHPHPDLVQQAPPQGTVAGPRSTVFAGLP